MNKIEDDNYLLWLFLDTQSSMITNLLVPRQDKQGAAVEEVSEKVRLPVNFRKYVSAQQSSDPSCLLSDLVEHKFRLFIYIYIYIYLQVGNII